MRVWAAGIFSRGYWFHSCLEAAQEERSGQGKVGVFRDKRKRERVIEAVFYLLVFASIMCFAMVQTYGDPPDEINRFKVVNYICKYGALPWGGPGSAFGGIWGILCFSAYSDLYYSGLFVTAFVFGYQ